MRIRPHHVLLSVLLLSLLGSALYAYPPEVIGPEEEVRIGVPRIAIITPNFTAIGASPLFHILSSILARAGLCSYVNYTAIEADALDEFDVAVLASLGEVYDNGYVPDTILQKLVEFNRRGGGVLILGKPAILFPNSSFLGDFHSSIYAITETRAYWAFPDTSILHFLTDHPVLQGVSRTEWTMPTISDFFLDIYSAPSYVQPIIAFDMVWRGYPAVAAAAVDPPDRGRAFVSVYAPRSRSDPLPFLSKRLWWNIVRWVAGLDTSTYIELPVFLELEALKVHSCGLALRFDDRAEEHLEAVLRAGYPATLLLVSTFLDMEPWLDHYTEYLWKNYELELADHTFSHCGDAELLLQGYGSIENGTYLEIARNIESCRNRFHIVPLLFAPPGGAAPLYRRSAYKCSPPIITSLAISAYYPTQLYGLPVLTCPGGRIRDDWSYTQWVREVRLSVRVDRLISSELHPALTIPRIGELLRLLSWIRSTYPDMLFTTLGRENLIRYEQYSIQSLIGSFNGTHYVLNMSLSRIAYCLFLNFPNATIRSVYVDGKPIYTFSEHVILLPFLLPGPHVVTVSTIGDKPPHIEGLYVKHPYLPIVRYTVWNGSELEVVVGKDERWILNETWPARLYISVCNYVPECVTGARVWSYDPVEGKLTVDLALSNETCVKIQLKPAVRYSIRVVNPYGYPVAFCSVTAITPFTPVSTYTNSSGYASFGYLPNTTLTVYIEGVQTSIPAGTRYVQADIPTGYLHIRGVQPPVNLVLCRGVACLSIVSSATEIHLCAPVDADTYRIIDGSGCCASGTLQIRQDAIVE
ncbi:carboxypeptidase regulatory-like domain-containing protein, partial [archaeon]|nr:carboxypeptidase regulatory-like domain-containing protein [archaeon]